MNISDLNPDLITVANVELVNKILFDGITDDGEKGDIILVFGSSRAPQYRVPVAVELYKSNRAPIILMSGGNLEPQEAYTMRERAIQLGVLERDIWIETRSTHTVGNVKESMAVLDEQVGLSAIKRILVVTTQYHMRRCQLTLKTFLPPHIELTLCSANDPITEPNSWWQNEKGYMRVLKEVRGLIHYTRTGKIIDYEFE